MIRLYIDKIGSDCYDTDKKKTKEVLLKSLQRSGGSSPERRRNLRKAGTLQWELNRFISERDIERSCRCPFSFVLGLLTAPGIADRIRYGIDDYTDSGDSCRYQPARTFRAGIMYGFAVRGHG